MAKWYKTTGTVSNYRTLKWAGLKMNEEEVEGKLTLSSFLSSFHQQKPANDESHPSNLQTKAYPSQEVQSECVTVVSSHR
jgi:hypothetical protein